MGPVISLYKKMRAGHALHQTGQSAAQQQQRSDYGKSGGDGGSSAGGGGRFGGHVAGHGERVPGGRDPATVQHRRPQGHRRNSAAGVSGGDPGAARRAGTYPYATHTPPASSLD